MGGVGDLLWHQVFGIEQGIAALLSPTHLLLFTGVALILLAPFRAAWSSPESPSAGVLGMLPALLSITLLWRAEVSQASAHYRRDVCPWSSGR